MGLHYLTGNSKRAIVVIACFVTLGFVVNIRAKISVLKELPQLIDDVRALRMEVDAIHQQLDAKPE